MIVFYHCIRLQKIILLKIHTHIIIENWQKAMNFFMKNLNLLFFSPGKILDFGIFEQNLKGFRYTKLKEAI